jgi:preprotein translocase subunit YajC
MWTDAFAQAPGGGADPGNPMIGTILNAVPFVAMLAIFYFLIIRPQQQKQKAMETMLKALKKGDRVLTTGGLYGVVVGIDEGKVVLRIAEDVKAEFTRSAVVQVIGGEAKS